MLQYCHQLCKWKGGTVLLKKKEKKSNQPKTSKQKNPQNLVYNTCVIVSTNFDYFAETCKTREI